MTTPPRILAKPSATTTHASANTTPQTTTPITPTQTTTTPPTPATPTTALPCIVVVIDSGGLWMLLLVVVYV